MNDKLTFELYLVAFLDLVGQRDALRKLRTIPATPAENEQFMETARQSVGKVLELRTDFAKFLNARKAARLDRSSLPAKFRETMRAATEMEFTMWGVSDSVVIAVPLNGDDECCKAINGVELTFHSIITGCIPVPAPAFFG